MCEVWICKWFLLHFQHQSILASFHLEAPKGNFVTANNLVTCYHKQWIGHLTHYVGFYPKAHPDWREDRVTLISDWVCHLTRQLHVALCIGLNTLPSLVGSEHTTNRPCMTSTFYRLRVCGMCMSCQTVTYNHHFGKIITEAQQRFTSLPIHSYSPWSYGGVIVCHNRVMNMPI